MKAIETRTSHLFQRGSVYYFRLALPRPLRVLAGCQEVRVSLRTGYLRTAKERAARLTSASQDFLRHLMTDPSMSALSAESLRALMREYFHEKLAQYETWSITQPTRTRESLESSVSALRQIREGVQESIALRSFDRVKQDALNLIAEKALPVDQGSPEFRMVSYEILKTNLDVLDVLIHRQQGDFAYEAPVMERYVRPEKPAAQPVLEPAAQPASNLTLGSLIDLYCRNKIDQGSWSTTKSELDVRGNLEWLTFILGDIALSRIDLPAMMDFRKKLLRMPPQRKKKPEYRDKAVDQLLAMDISKTLQPKTINNIIDATSSLFAFAVKHGYMERNPAEGLQIRIEEREDEHRDPFSPEDLRLIFSHPEVRDGKGFKHWLPILALFTGARIEELCQLHLEDIYEEDGVWVVDINNKGEKRLKSKSAKRKVPLHDVLIRDLRLLDHIETLRSQGHDRLFPDLKRIGTRFGHYASRWFTELRRELGILDKKKFHSFRHTLINDLRCNQVPEEYIAQTVGHKLKGIVEGAYKKHLPPSFMKREVLDKLTLHAQIGMSIISEKK